ncbi:sulfite exporter TauE/SafE family protein [Aestuariibacter halophilus]|uniref:Probable membrane transporter protein n=1 Tax=Fluctibacter halophilus TaxID=226011 RepID=A0ABS8GCE9_9ALTE|nr:sulfite exporter TauE/SafE family protein [Aestuariibacter halophilus]MCC2617921.1 sulfite exporter TauE/SafE family protein [Aestuariibacter halophilus]
MTAMLGWLGALIIGLLLGILGAGGSIVTVPLLVYGFDQGGKLAIAQALLIVGIIAALSSIAPARQGRVVWSMVLGFGIPSMLATLLGAWLSQWLSGQVQLMIFALVMLIAAGFMFRPLKVQQNTSAEPHWLAMLLGGLGVGILAGLVGIGGGFLIVPALVGLAGLSMLHATATSLVVIALQSFVGFAKHYHVLLGLGLAVDFGLILKVVLLGVLGAVIGQAIANKVPAPVLKKVFAVTLLLLGSGMLVGQWLG